MKRFFKFIMTGKWFKTFQLWTIFLLFAAPAGLMVVALTIFVLKLTGVIP